VKTVSIKNDEVERDWYVIDAQGETLGRLVTKIATVLCGKHKPVYTRHVDCGDYVIVVNAEKVHTTGRKMLQKRYYRHSGYPGGLTSISLRDQLKKFPERVIEHAVRGMLPKSRLGGQMYKKLKVYGGSTHPHEAQKPQVMEVK